MLWQELIGQTEIGIFFILVDGKAGLTKSLKRLSKDLLFHLAHQYLGKDREEKNKIMLPEIPGIDNKKRCQAGRSWETYQVGPPKQLRPDTS